jgi:ferredoxin
VDTYLLTIAAEKCQGHARCCDLAPALFDLDEIGERAYVRVAEVTDEALLTQANRAVAGCPESAITLRLER